MVIKTCQPHVGFNDIKKCLTLRVKSKICYFQMYAFKSLEETNCDIALGNNIQMCVCVWVSESERERERERMLVCTGTNSLLAMVVPVLRS